MTEERQEKNRRLAEWLGILHGRFCGLLNGGLKCDCGGYRPDFYASEDASSLLLDKMLSLGFMVEMWPIGDGRIIVVFVFRKVPSVRLTFGLGHVRPNRMAAIADSVSEYIESLAAQEKK